TQLVDLLSDEANVPGLAEVVRVARLIRVVVLPLTGPECENTLSVRVPVNDVLLVAAGRTDLEEDTVGSTAGDHRVRGTRSGRRSLKLDNGSREAADSEGGARERHAAIEKVYPWAVAALQDDATGASQNVAANVLAVGAEKPGLVVLGIHSADGAVGLACAIDADAVHVSYD